jgi:energy-converting hydrogenase Eha subunit E
MRRPLTRPSGPNASGANGSGPGGTILWDLLTFRHLMTNEVIHLIYWAGVAIVTLGVFGTIGAAVGVAIRDPSFFGILLAIPVVIGGLIIMAALLLLWRSFCEFYVAIFKISDDLSVLRADVEAERARIGKQP